MLSFYILQENFRKDFQRRDTHNPSFWMIILPLLEN